MLGVGATVTLASWNDSEYASTTLTSSVFTTESSVNGAAYAENGVSPGPVVTFAGAGFAPGTVQYLPVLVRTRAASIAGTVALQPPVVSGADAATLGAAFVYRVVRSTTCNSAAFTTGTPSFVVGAAATYRPFTAGQETGVSNPLAAATAGAPGASTGFCFELTLPANAANTLQGKSATATWQFLATSS